jgi:hypothetical protein
VLDEVVADLRVVPRAPVGGLGAGVVLVHEGGILLLLEGGSVGRTGCQRRAS